MRALTRIALTAAAAAAAVALGTAPASAAPPQPCGQVYVGPCYVHDDVDGPYTCTFVYVNTGEAEVCLVKWQP